ncbi:hypothetical protein [Azospirillum sp. TSH58]|nr:hypothetical protein [Azospirillum sp. TSH58]
MFGGVLAAIGASAISQGVNYLGQALTDAASERTWKVFASRNFETSKDNFPRCVQIARGKFLTSPSKHALDTLPEWSGHRANDAEGATWKVDQRKAVIDNGLWLAERPDFFFEGIFRASSDNSALTIEPVVVMLDEPIGTRLLRTGQSRQVAVFMSLHAPGSDPSLEKAPAATIKVGGISRQEPRMFRTSVDAREDGISSAVSMPFESPWFQLSKTDAVKPMTASVLVTETESASEFIAFLGRVLNDQTVKTKTTTALQELVIPERRQAAEQSERQQEVTANNEADTKFADAIIKLRACSAATTRVEESAAAALTAMRDANIKARIAGRNEPFRPEHFSRINLTAGPPAIVGSCGAALSSVVTSG